MATILKMKHTGDYEFAEVEPDKDGGIGLKTLQECVGGFIERVPIPKPGCEGLDLWLNEEGKLLQLPVNEAATSLSEIWKFGDFIVGDVAVCASSPEGDSVGLSEAQVVALRKAIA